MLPIVCVLAQNGTGATDAIEHYTSWPVVIATCLVVGLCTLLHFETLRLLVRVLMRKVRSFRLVMLGTVFSLVVLHLVEIVIFGLAIWFVLTSYGSQVGQLDGAYDDGLPDAIYFSFSVYTTVGFGDITPLGPIRLLCGVEALLGLVLITWSASFTFLIMQRRWGQMVGDEDDPHTNPHAVDQPQSS